jgi:hypothetical protein
VRDSVQCKKVKLKTGEGVLWKQRSEGRVFVVESRVDMRSKNVHRDCHVG